MNSPAQCSGRLVTQEQRPLDEKISHSLKLLSRRGGDYHKDERTFIAETLKELAEAIDLTRSRDHEPTPYSGLES